MEPGTADVEVIGAVIREKRKLSGHNVKTLAAKADVSAPYMSQIETGAKKRVSPAVFIRICDALGIPKHNRHQLVKTGQAVTS